MKPLRPLKDTDTGDTAQKLKAAIWSGLGGLIGMFLGIGIGARMGAAFPGMVIGFFAGWLVTYLVSYGAASRIGSAASGIYMPTGSSTPGDRQYSLAQSFVARGKFEEAAAEYARCADVHADDPEPALRLARLYRDDLQRYSDAIVWFKRACAIPTVGAGTDVMATRELIEVYTHRLKQPSNAMPHMARLAAKHPDTPAGQWAKRELQALKATLGEPPVPDA